MLAQQTLKFCKECQDYPLLAHLGWPVEATVVRQVSDWRQALSILSDDLSYSFRQERDNEVCLQIPKHRFQGWNDYVEQVEVELSATLERVWDVLAQMPVAGRFRHEAHDRTRLDLISAAMEHQYADALETQFYREMVQWYSQGHLVCGWEQREGGFLAVIY